MSSTALLRISDFDRVLLRRSAHQLDRSATHAAAEHIYAEFAMLPGTANFLYDLPVRIRSTAALLDFLIEQFSTDPVGADRMTAMFTAVGASHARAGLPPALIDQGAEVFGRCLGRAAEQAGCAWEPSYSEAWTRLIAAGTEIQKSAYTALAERPNP